MRAEFELPLKFVTPTAGLQKERRRSVSERVQSVCTRSWINQLSHIFGVQAGLALNLSGKQRADVGVKS